MHDQFLAMIDANHRAFILFVHSSRWLGIRLDFAAAICVSVAALLVVLLRNSISPGLAGNNLSNSFDFSTTENFQLFYVCTKLLVLVCCVRFCACTLLVLLGDDNLVECLQAWCWCRVCSSRDSFSLECVLQLKRRTISPVSSGFR